ncbi:MAG: hypothetical protein D4S00_05200 [Streptomycetaceae bacterium]|nr:MAG: hypothetical protein D4S00_05200 [Streptomycetaceae bacterium]
MRRVKILIVAGSLGIALMVATLGYVSASSAQASMLTATRLMADTSNPYGGTNIDPLPATSTIFTVTNGKKSTNYSKNDLLKIKSSVISIFEPFVQKKQSFTVIPLDYFLAKSSISASVTIDTIALNDYIFSEKSGNFSKAKAYIAIARFGKDIPYNQGGPIRLIYTGSSTWSKNLSAWNWSLRSIKVHKTA